MTGASTPRAEKSVLWGIHFTMFMGVLIMCGYRDARSTSGSAGQGFRVITRASSCNSEITFVSSVQARLVLLVWRYWCLVRRLRYDRR